MKLQYVAVIILMLGASLAGAQTAVLSQDFSVFNGETVDGSSDISTTMDTYFPSQPGWTGARIYKSPGRVKLGSSNGQGYITTPTLDLSADSGNATFSFNLLQYGSDAGKYVQVYHAPDGVTFSQVGADIAIPASATVVTAIVTGGTAASKLQIKAKLASYNRFYLDDVLVIQNTGTGLATVTTLAISAITAYAASGGGTVVSDGGNTVTARGVCWATSSSPTVSGSHSTDGSGTGSFTSSLTGLSEETLYYVRAYASNSSGTAYGGEVQFTTLSSDPYSGYYDPVDGLSGTALKNGLHDLIDNNGNTDYDGSKYYMFQILDNVSGTVRCVYTGRDYSISGSYDGSSDPNTEHTFAQSWFGTSEASIKKADLHHLFICSMPVNSSRGNLPFDEVVNATTTYDSYNGYVSLRGTNSDGDTVFEPADQHKGNLARALLYFSVRYSMSLSQEGVDMLPTLLTWHVSDPVDAAELQRNANIYSFQDNRNPFIDHPEYVYSIWGGSAPNTTLSFQPASAVVSEDGDSVQLTVGISNPDPSNPTTASIILSDGSASDVGNYTEQNISFPSGSLAPQTVTVYITDDSLLEGTELLVFNLSSISGGNGAAAGNYPSFNLSIVDNDIPTVLATAATEVDFYGFTANWQAASGITDYWFDLSTDPAFSSFVGSYHDLPVTVTSLAVGGLATGTDYYYRLRAVFNESAGEYSDPVAASTLELIILDDPVALAATAVSHEGFTAWWDPVSGADGYYLDVFQGESLVATDLLISEYVEGSSYNKYIEIFNGTGVEADLSDYRLRTYYNGSTTAGNDVQLSGTLAAGACLVCMNSQATLILPVGVTAVANSAVNFNGNDAVALYRISSDANVDIFGRIGEDPGSAWTSGDLSTADRTLRRKQDVSAGVTTNPASGFPTLAAEWEVFGTDTSDGLGGHYIGGSEPVAGFDNLSVYSSPVRVSGLDASTDYNYRVRAYNAGDTSGYSNQISVSTAAISSGSGANTSIGGEAALVEVAALPSYADNRVSIDPVGADNHDYSVTVQTIEDGISYSVSTSDNLALNGTYILYHDGLNATPATLAYSLDGVDHTSDSFVSSSTQTQVTISGLSRSGKGTLTISLTGDETLPVELSSFTVCLNAFNQISLQWISQTETGLVGYQVLRGQTGELAFAEVVSPLIGATNTSQQQQYLFTDTEDLGAGCYHYWLQSLDLGGGTEWHGPVSIDYQGTGQASTPPLPLQTGIRGVYPNPFSEGAHIGYDLARDETARLEIYNLRGQLVRRFDNLPRNQGSYSLWWDARNDKGEACGSGMYLVRLRTPDGEHSRKLLIVK
jgi:hypothetical protein